MKFPVKVICPKCGREMSVTKNTFTEGPERKVTLVTFEFKCVCNNTLVKPLYSR